MLQKSSSEWEEHRWARGGAKGVLPPLEKIFMTPPSIQNDPHTVGCETRS